MTRLPLLLGELRPPAIGGLRSEIAERSDRKGWPADRVLSALADIEVAGRARWRTERHPAEGRLPSDKTMDNFDFAYVPMLSRARVAAIGRSRSSLSAWRVPAPPPPGGQG